MAENFPDLDFGATLRGFNAGQRLFDRYTLKEILGRGGMGIVWRAFDEQLERDVALKFLPELVAFDETAIADLKRETKKSQELRHHHIVQVYDFVANKQNACISMEYVDGPTLSALKARKEQGFLEVDEIKPWMIQLCQALAYAHQRAHVIHRDLKPANLMINSKGELKVTDFGIARSVSDSVSMLTMTRGISGTLVYMSPQQLGGQRASHLDDIYSVGVSIYELLTSKPPFYSGDVTDQIKNVKPVSMQQRRLDLGRSDSPIPKQWEETVAACLAKDPAQRPQSIAEIAERLELKSPQIAEVGEVRVKRSKKKAFLVAAAMTMCLVAAATWHFGIRVPGEKASTKPALPIVSQPPKEAAATTAPSPVTAPAAVGTSPALTWKTFPPGKMPLGRLVGTGDLRDVAEHGLAGERIYLKGQFVVNFSDANRAVLRTRSKKGDTDSSIRIIVEFPVGYSLPQRGSIVNRDEARPYEITEVRKQSDGVLNVFVREIIQL